MCPVYHSGMTGGCVQSTKVARLVDVSRLPLWHDWWMCRVYHSGMTGGCVQSTTVALLVDVYRPPQWLDWWMCTDHNSGLIDGRAREYTTENDTEIFPTGLPDSQVV